MRILVCGDIHCKPDIIKKAVKACKWDLFVFLGDACDNWGATQDDNLDVIHTLIDLKHEYGEKFVWLLGNHDWGYYDTSVRMSGHIYANEDKVGHLLANCIDLWEVFFMKDKYIFSHAGISWPFLNERRSVWELKHCTGKDNPLNWVGEACGGSSEVPSPLWARPSEVIPLPIDNIQIVGHTPTEGITMMQDGKLFVCDTFSQYPTGEFIGDKSLLLIEDGNMVAVDYKTGKELYGF